MGALLGSALGPIIGGVLCQYLGWRSVFWFLTIFGGITALLIVVFLPETCRKIVGNGALPPQKWNVSLLSYLALRKRRRAVEVPNEVVTRSHFSRPNPLNTIWIILDKESGIVLFYASLLFAGYYMVMTGMPSQFQAKYGFNNLQIGLCYLPIGFGSLTAAVVQGHFLDWNFRRHSKKLAIEINKSKQQDLTKFPIEAARLQVVLPLVAMSGLTTIAYGWVMEYHTLPAGPLVLLYFLAFCISSTFQGCTALVVDLNRESPGTASAAMNLVRCWLAAGAVAAVIPLMDAIGIGWVSVFVAGIWLVMSPVVFLVIKRGPEWREEKRRRLEEKEKTKERRKAGNVEEGRVESTRSGE
jgi:MFS family permease